MHEKAELQLYFVRHAQSRMNLAPDIVGGRSPDTPLTSLGERQAAALGDRFASEKVAFDAMFVSPYVRTQETAAIVARRCQIAYREDADALVELSQGDWTGRPRAEVYTPELRQRMAQVHYDFAAPGGESQRMLERRVSNWLEDRVFGDPRLTDSAGVRHVLFVTHGVTIKCLMHYVMAFDRSLVWKIDIDNTSISRVVRNPRGWWVKALNDTAHLYGLETRAR